MIGFVAFLAFWIVAIFVADRIFVGRDLDHSRKLLDAARPYIRIYQTKDDVEAEIERLLEKMKAFNWCDCGTCRILLPYYYGKLKSLYWVLGEWSNDRREMSERALEVDVAFEMFGDHVAEQCYDLIYERGLWPSHESKWKNFRWRLRVLLTGKIDERKVDASHFAKGFLKGE